MNSNIIIYLTILIIFSWFSIKQDILNRKISNKLQIFFFLISIFLFIINFKFLIIENIIILFLIPIISFFLYKYNFWGAADGKLYITLSIFLLSIYNYTSIVNFSLNIFIFFSIGIIFLSIFKTSIKSKMQVIKKFNYKKKIFLLLIIFTLISIFYKIFFEKDFSFTNLIIFFASLILFIGLISHSLEKYFNKIDEELIFFINIILFLLLFLFSKLIFIKYFIFVLSFKLFLDFISKSTDNIKIKHKLYTSPFSIYIFISAIFTLITNSNVLVILIKFFI